MAASAASHPPYHARYCKHESRGRVIDPVYCLRENEKIGLVVLEYTEKKQIEKDRTILIILDLIPPDNTQTQAEAETNTGNPQKHTPKRP